MDPDEIRRVESTVRELENELGRARGYTNPSGGKTVLTERANVP
jgi:hypothetical protein